MAIILCWKDLGNTHRDGTIHCGEIKGHEGACVGALQWYVTPSNFGPVNCDWSTESTELWQKIWIAVQDHTILALSREEVDRLGGMFWNLGVFK